MNINLKNALKLSSMFIMNQLILIILILLNYNTSVAICKLMKLDNNLRISIRSIGIVFDITLILLLMELLILYKSVKIIKNKKNRVNCIQINDIM